MKLTPAQERLVREISRLKVDTAAKRTEFYAVQAARESEFLATAEAPLHDAMYEAFKAGVPKTRIGQAYQSKDFATVNKILRKYTDSTASLDKFEVVREDDLYTVHVTRLANWTASADAGRVLRDATVQFTMEDGFPTFVGDDPWEDERAPLARQIEVYSNSEHALNREIRSKI